MSDNQKPDKAIRNRSCGNHCEACARLDDKIESLTTRIKEVEGALKYIRDYQVYGCSSDVLSDAVDGMKGVAREALQPERTKA